MSEPDFKLSNPKDSIGSDKLPLHLVPASLRAYCALGLLEGACKYGRANWRATGVRASIYYDAAGRHLDAWFEGQTHDPVTGIPHLANAVACLAILIDAGEADMLIDDRNVEGGFAATRNWANGEVPRIKALFAEHNPKHWTIDDYVPEKVGTRMARKGTLDELSALTQAVDSCKTAIAKSRLERQLDLLEQDRVFGHDPKLRQVRQMTKEEYRDLVLNRNK